MLTHLLAVLGFSVALMLWSIFQRWLDRADPEVRNIWDRGCGGCSHGSCRTGSCGTDRCPAPTAIDEPRR